MALIEAVETILPRVSSPRPCGIRTAAVQGMTAVEVEGSSR